MVYIPFVYNGAFMNEMKINHIHYTPQRFRQKGVSFMFHKSMIRVSDVQLNKNSHIHKSEEYTPHFMNNT